MANSMDGQNSILSVVGPLATTVPALRLLVKSLLSQKPWLYDPLVVELPWRDDQEKTALDLIKSSQSGGGELAFGVLKHDGVITPQPPVARAMDIVVETLKKLGHKIIEWEPPSHDELNTIVFTTWFYDGGKDIHDAFALSGEPISPQIVGAYGHQTGDQMDGTKIAATNVAKREMQKRYMDYWNSTEELTGTGRPVDGFIAPLAPFAAARREKYSYYGYSTFVNGLDYTSCVIPVTTADKAVDKVYEGYQPLNEPDKTVYEDCKYHDLRIGSLP
jgi:amidase